MAVGCWGIRSWMIWICFSGLVSSAALLAGVDTGALREVLVADGHAVEPGDALDLDDVDHRHVLGILGGAARWGAAAAAGASADRAAACDQRHGQSHRTQKGYWPVSHSSLLCELPHGYRQVPDLRDSKRDPRSSQAITCAISRIMMRILHGMAGTTVYSA